jgi:ssDNA thymidine ADP-ribosyltransferase, DarT
MPAAPQPTPIYRLVHVDNLTALLTRGRLHAPHHMPADGMPYRTIHDANVQANRRIKDVPCGPGGTVHDYLPFYFGPLSVMLLQLKTGQVAGYTEGQEPLVYLRTTVQAVTQAGCPFVFTDGHGLAKFTRWFDDLAHLDEVDWPLVRDRFWADTPDDNDRKRRKQAEFLVWQGLDWDLLDGIGVFSDGMRQRVQGIIAGCPERRQVPVRVTRNLYYP